MTAHADDHAAMFSDKTLQVHPLFGFATNGIAEYCEETVHNFLQLPQN